MLIPVLPLSIAVITLILILIVNLLDEKFHPIVFTLSIINILGFLLYLFIYKDFIDKEWFEYLFLSHSGFVGIVLLVTIFLLIKRILFFKNHYKMFLNSIKTSEWNAYYVVDKKDRIKEMSESILDELGFTFEEVKDKNIFEVFNKSIRITNLDEVETNNRLLEAYYKDYPKTAKKDQLDKHTLLFQNYQGKSAMLKTVEQPIFIMGRYRGRINIGEKRSDFDLVGIERQLKVTENELESLRLKYVATIELTNDGLYYIDLDEKYFWGSDKFLNLVGLEHNMLDIRDFHNLIYKEDLNTYLGSLSNLTTRKDTFKTRYRILIDGQYVWVDDKGKRIFDDKTSNVIVGSLSVVDTKGYGKVGKDILDNLKTESELIPHLKKLKENNRRFQLALFDLRNIPEINKEYGREVGDMLIAEYVKRLMDSFMSESSEIFRISGLEFAVTILDPQKMQLLKIGSTKNPKFLNMEMNYGSINAEIDAYLGVCSSYYQAKDEQQIYDRAKQALSLTKHIDFKGNVCYYEDVNE